MNLYPFLFVLHITFAGMWLAFLIINLFFVKKFKTENILSNTSLSLYLNFTMVFELLGALGMLLTGIYMVTANSDYGFFVMTSNHWLATKQIIFVIILLLIFVGILPIWKKLNTMVNRKEIIEQSNAQFKKLKKTNLVITILVLLNFLFAITHTFYS